MSTLTRIAQNNSNAKQLNVSEKLKTATQHISQRVKSSFTSLKLAPALGKHFLSTQSRSQSPRAFRPASATRPTLSARAVEPYLPFETYGESLFYNLGAVGRSFHYKCTASCGTFGQLGTARIKLVNKIV